MSKSFDIKSQINLTKLHKKKYQSPEYQRLIKVQKKINFNQKKFVALLEIERQTLYNIRDREDAFIPAQCIKILAREFDWLNIDWLIRGVGIVDKREIDSVENPFITGNENVLKDEIKQALRMIQEEMLSMKKRLKLLEER